MSASPLVCPSLLLDDDVEQAQRLLVTLVAVLRDRRGRETVVVRAKEIDLIDTAGGWRL